MIERITEVARHLHPENKGQIPARKETINKLYGALNVRLAMHRQGQIIAKNDSYQISKTAEDGRIFLTIVRLPTPTRTSFISYTLFRKTPEELEIEIIKNQVSQSTARGIAEAAEDEYIPGTPIGGFLTGLERRHREHLRTYREQSKAFAESMDSPAINEREIRRLVRDVRKGLVLVS